MTRKESIEIRKDLLLYEIILIAEYKKRLDKYSAKKSLRKVLKEELLAEKIQHDTMLRKIK